MSESASVLPPSPLLGEGVQSERRAFLTLGAAAAAALGAGCATPGPAPFVQPRAIEVASGVYMLRGAPGEFGPGNLGRVGNAGFIVGDAGVVGIDTGTSYRHGVALLQEIARVTSLPVRRVLITHTRQEFLFGALAFRERGIAIHMHAATAALMQARCAGCLKTLRSVLGEAELDRTAMFTPDAVFDDAHSVELIGRPLRVLYFGHSSGPGDIAVHDVASGVVFGGGLLDAGRIPDITDSDFAAWQRALVALRALPITTIVPGHGPAGGVALIDAIARYLRGLEARVVQMLKDGAALSEAADRAAWPEFAHWDQYATIHRRNASILYLRLEQ